MPPILSEVPGWAPGVLVVSDPRPVAETPSGRQRFNALGSLHAVTHEGITVTNDTDINSESVVWSHCSMRSSRSDLPTCRSPSCWITPGIHASSSNLIERLWKFVKAECLRGRYYPKFGPFKQAIIDCLADTSGRHQAQLNTLLTLNFPIFKSGA